MCSTLRRACACSSRGSVLLPCFQEDKRPERRRPQRRCRACGVRAPPRRGCTRCLHTRQGPRTAQARLRPRSAAAVPERGAGGHLGMVPSSSEDSWRGPVSVAGSESWGGRAVLSVSLSLTIRSTLGDVKMWAPACLRKRVCVFARVQACVHACTIVCVCVHLSTCGQRRDTSRHRGPPGHKLWAPGKAPLALSQTHTLTPRSAHTAPCWPPTPRWRDCLHGQTSGLESTRPPCGRWGGGQIPSGVPSE